MILKNKNLKILIFFLIVITKTIMRYFIIIFRYQIFYLVNMRNKYYNMMNFKKIHKIKIFFYILDTLLDFKSYNILLIII